MEGGESSDGDGVVVVAVSTRGSGWKGAALQLYDEHGNLPLLPQPLLHKSPSLHKMESKAPLWYCFQAVVVDSRVNTQELVREGS